MTTRIVLSVGRRRELLVKEQVRVVNAPDERSWAPGYDAVLFGDPANLPLTDFPECQHYPE